MAVDSFCATVDLCSQGMACQPTSFISLKPLERKPMKEFPGSSSLHVWVYQEDLDEVVMLYMRYIVCLLVVGS